MIYMANNRKVLQLSSKHRTKAEKARREYEESLIQSDGADLDDVITVCEYDCPEGIRESFEASARGSGNGWKSEQIGSAELRE